MPVFHTGISFMVRSAEIPSGETPPARIHQPNLGRVRVRIRARDRVRVKVRLGFTGTVYPGVISGNLAS